MALPRTFHFLEKNFNFDAVVTIADIDKNIRYSGKIGDMPFRHIKHTYVLNIEMGVEHDILVTVIEPDC